ncbi:lipopolysaccharide heptosyltransferase II [Gilvimarinus algae]|uniref:lipopolysaccharide heptosyltransferase II n=1 Tax=Gilvimarinus algae TaxID=3058037 RepID=A0ABT8TAI5_9GAMM|nr:lipopolysaccharide heptosyltransferase II [Gilvimarinus sp. SDUM040014]MDO3381018.1 lipopolysaccharide heptosyltransferase II [Gilvimarinus sp. SDUM040014]
MSTERILVIGPSWVGDMVMAQSLFATLQQRFVPEALDVLAPAWSRPLTERMREVGGSIDMPVGHGSVMLGERWRLARQLAKRGYTRAYVLPNSLKSALIPAFAGIDRRVGWRGEMRYGLLNDLRRLEPARYPLMVERFVALAYEPGVALPEHLPRPSLVADTDRYPDLLQTYGLERQRPILALCPGAEFGPSKRWPSRHYSRVAEAKLAEGWQVWVFGSGKDAAVAQRIYAQLPQSRSRCHLLAGKTSLADAIDLLSMASAVVSNDSGLMHIAAALNRPLVAVYGSTSAAFTPPLGSAVETLSLALSCQPCFARECPLGHKQCLEELAPEQVLAALARLGV